MIDLREKLGKLSERWSPRVVAGMNGYRFKLAKAQGEFVRHGHADADEVFIVADGNLRIEFRDGAVEPGPGEMYVAPKGIEHRPAASEECRIVLAEPRGVADTGEAGGDHAAPNDVWE